MSAARDLPADTPLLLRSVEGETLPTTWGVFLADNESLRESGEADDIARTLTAGETYVGGGGAAPAWAILPIVRGSLALTCSCGDCGIDPDWWECEARRLPSMIFAAVHENRRRGRRCLLPLCLVCHPHVADAGGTRYANAGEACCGPAHEGENPPRSSAAGAWALGGLV